MLGANCSLLRLPSGSTLNSRHVNEKYNIIKYKFNVELSGVCRQIVVVVNRKLPTKWIRKIVGGIIVINSRSTRQPHNNTILWPACLQSVRKS